MAVKVCLDAGHYGKYNRSPAVSSYYESDMTWKLHNYLKKELEAFGIVVLRKHKFLNHHIDNDFQENNQIFHMFIIL